MSAVCGWSGCSKNAGSPWITRERKPALAGSWSSTVEVYAFRIALSVLITWSVAMSSAPARSAVADAKSSSTCAARLSHHARKISELRGSDALISVVSSCPPSSIARTTNSTKSDVSPETSSAPSVTAASSTGMYTAPVDAASMTGSAHIATSGAHDCAIFRSEFACSAAVSVDGQACHHVTSDAGLPRPTRTEDCGTVTWEYPEGMENERAAK
mmetsp:Transcript_33355/g.78666  ORF Transcript_33355/g.78666 Transcript_33355/m.78666 type:complete len:214 (-) Transcript_33355:1449-2090(-)